MQGVVVGEGNQDHKDDGHHRKDQNTQQRQAQQGLVELIIHHGPQVILTGAELLAALQDALGDLILLNIQSPGVDETNDEEQGQHTVEKDLKGIVVVTGHVLIQEFVVFLHGALVTQVVQHGQPVDAAEDHVHDESHLHQEEQQATKHLAAGDGAKAHHKIGNTGLPVTFLEGNKDIDKFNGHLAEELADRVSEILKAIPDATGNAYDQAHQGIQEPMTLRQS